VWEGERGRESEGEREGERGRDLLSKILILLGKFGFLSDLNLPLKSTELIKNLKCCKLREKL
jgi:hypothetical protein